MNEAILTYIRNSRARLSVHQIAQALNYPVATVIRAVEAAQRARTIKKWGQTMPTLARYSAV